MNKNKFNGTSLVVQCLRLCASTAGGMALIPGRGTKMPHATWHGQKKKKKFKFVGLINTDMSLDSTILSIVF